MKKLMRLVAVLSMMVLGAYAVWAIVELARCMKYVQDTCTNLVISNNYHMYVSDDLTIPDDHEGLVVQSGTMFAGGLSVCEFLSIGPVTICTTNGVVTIKDGVTMDEASREFWKCLEQTYPAMFPKQEECK